MAHILFWGTFSGLSFKNGADIVVQSAHKTPPAMTMGSYLHLNSNAELIGIVWQSI